MTMQPVVTTHVAARGAAVPAWSLPSDVKAESAGSIVLSFLDTATTALGRATHYNSREDQQRAELAAHEALLALDRDLYALFLMLPGVTDRARQVGLKNLLGVGRDGRSRILDEAAERRVVRRIVDELPAQRALKLFEALRVGAPDEGIHKANNARTRKLILRVVLGSPRLELWAVKYRTKMASALTHAWGVRKAGIVRAILAKDEAGWTAKERSILKHEIDRYAAPDTAKVYACVGFVLGNRNRMTLPLLQAFDAAKSDIAAGAKLPPEVLEGIRSTFHKALPKDEVLRVTAASLTTGQKMAVQRRAASAGLDVRMDPRDYDPVRLYLYAFEMGMTVDIARALLEKAEKAARAFPVRYASIGILLDASASMMGSGEQKLRPMATALALRDTLQFVGKASVVIAGGEGHALDSMLVRPAGDTSLAEGLIDLVERGPEAIFVISDGYENRPAGRFAEVVAELRSMGIRTPIYHLNPVFAAESVGVRSLAEGLCPTLPVKDPEGTGLSFLRGLIEADPVRGIDALVRLALPQGVN